MIARGAGCVVRTHGETVSAALPGARIGDGVLVRSAAATLSGEVVALERSRVSIAPFGAVAGVAVGDRVEIAPDALCFPVGFSALGRALDATGEPLDARPPLRGLRIRIERGGAPAPGEREPVSVPLWTGVRAIDGFLTPGRGARVGLFGAPGAGKTTLLESIAAAARADAVVIALVGERGREAQTWCGRLDRRTTIVCATSDRSAAERVRAADAAMAQAEHLRAAGLHVVMILDSLARYAAALREQRIALGEHVGRGGYPPGVWSAFARYLERAGNGSHGSITLFATVLSDGADEREPVSDAARSLLDGHVALSSGLAAAGHFPAIDVLESTSRTMLSVVSNDHARAARAVRSALALLAQTADARAVGLAVEGAALRAAVGAESAFDAFLRQTEPCAPEHTLRSLRSLASLLEPRP